MNLEYIIKRDGFQKFLNKCKSYKKDNPNEHMIIWSDSNYYYRDISVRFTTKTDYPNEYGKVVFIYSLCAEDAKRSNRKSMFDLECYVKEKLESEGMSDNSLEQKNDGV